MKVDDTCSLIFSISYALAYQYHIYIRFSTGTITATDTPSAQRIMLLPPGQQFATRSHTKTLLTLRHRDVIVSVTSSREAGATKSVGLPKTDHGHRMVEA